MHRFVGFWSFWLMGAHIVLLVARVRGHGRHQSARPAVAVHLGLPRHAAGDSRHALLVMVVVTSIRRARRRLRYESWHLLHLYAYLGVGLALPHQLWTGADFLSSPLATGLLVGTVGRGRGIRPGLPHRRAAACGRARHGIRVSAVERDGDSGVTVRMRGRDMHQLGAQRRPVLRLAIPRRRRLDARSPVLARRRARTRDGLVDLGPRRRATARSGSPAAARHAGAVRGPVRAHDRRSPHGHEAAHDRRRRRRRAAGRAARGASRYAPGEATLITRDHADARRAAPERDPQLWSRTAASVHAPLSTAPATPAHRRGCPPATAHGGAPDLIRYLAPDLGAYDVYLCGPVPWMDAVIARPARRRRRARPHPPRSIHRLSADPPRGAHHEEDHLRRTRHHQRARAALQLPHVARRGPADRVTDPAASTAATSTTPSTSATSRPSPSAMLGSRRRRAARPARHRPARPRRPPPG